MLKARKFVAIILLFYSVFSLASCGGGGGDGGDTTFPSVSSTSPANNQTNVAINSTVSATFSKAMDTTTVNSVTFIIKNSANNPINGTVSCNGTSSTFTPNGNFTYSTTYTATITTGVKDLAGNPMPGDYTWTFSTAPDATAPMVTSTNPADGTTDVAVNSAVNATFSEQMDASTIDVSTFIVKDAANNPVTGTVSYAGTIATFTPSTYLASSTMYTAIITTNAKDLAGNPMSGNYTWTFTTGNAPDISPPAVTSVSPDNGATDVAVNTSISATFSEPMNAVTVNETTFTAKDSANNPVNGTIGYSGTTAIFTPDANLTSSTTYTVTITTGAMDLAGNALAANFSWSFTTALSGSVDTTFGNGGMITVTFGGVEEEALAIALQPDGKAVIGGFADLSGIRKFALMRLDLNGMLDTSFGTGGIVNTTFDSSSWDIIGDLVIQADGKIVAAGGYSAFALARYNDDGSLDTGFGTNGTVRTVAGVSQSSAYSVALQPDGKIIAGGWGDQSGPPYGTRFTLIRYNSDGSLDTSFGSGGISRTLVDGYTATIRSIAIQPDGKIVAAGYAYTGSAYDFAFVRFNADGTIDTSFGTNGATIVPIGSGDDICYAMHLQSDGKIVGAGDTFVSSADSDFAVIRLTSQGALDPSFSAGGIVTTDFGAENRANGLAIQPDGKLIAAGFAFYQGFALARYNSDGSLDATFGNGGRVTINDSGLSFARAVAIQGDGRIIAAGISSTGDKDFAAVRFWP